MPSPPPLDGRTADAVLSGRSCPDDRPDLAAVAALVDGLRHATQAAPRPTPTPELQRILTAGITTDEGGLATLEVSGPPTRRSTKVLRIIAAKLAAAGLAVKAGVASAAVLAVTAGAGASGTLPDALQGPLDELRDRDQVEDSDVEVTGTEGSDGHDDAPGEGDLVTDDPAAEDPTEDPDDLDDLDADDRSGDRVAEEARDPQVPSVDGPAIADVASPGRSADALARAVDASEGRSVDAADAAERAADAPERAADTPERVSDARDERAAGASEARSQLGDEAGEHQTPSDVPPPVTPLLGDGTEAEEAADTSRADRPFRGP